MAQIDPEMAQRVWQRVRGEPPLPSSGPSLQLLMEDAWEDAGMYRQLSRRHRGRRAALFGQLYRQTMEHLRILKGICALTDRCDPVLSPVQPRREPEGIFLRRSYSRAQQRLSWYSAHENNPDYGHILAPLIRQTQDHSRLLLQMMTRTQNK